MLICCNAFTGADKTAKQIGFKAIIKYNKLTFLRFCLYAKA